MFKRVVLRNIQKGRSTWLISVLIFTNLALVLALIKSLRISSKHTDVAKTSNTTIETKEEKIVTSYIVTRNQETPPLTMGPQRVHYQYSNVLPQVYLTLISVLQGSVFSVLLLSVPIPPYISWENTYIYILQQHLYLPFIINAVMVLIIWSQLVNAVLFLSWPFTVSQSSLIFLLVLTQILAFEHITSFPTWLIGLSYIGIVGGLIRLNNLRYIHKKSVNWVPVLHKSTDITRKSQIRDGIFYIVAGIITLIAGFNWDIISNLISKNGYVNIDVVEWLVLIILMMVVVMVLLLDGDFRHKFLSKVVEGSDLTLSPEGVMSYKLGDDERD